MIDRCPARPAQFRLRTLAVCGIAIALLGSGCKFFGKSNNDPPARVTDPLLGAHIPPQNLPVPGKDSYAARERKDPLLGTPAGAEEPGANVSKPKPKTPTPGIPGAKIGSPREPYLPGRESTTAALAAHVQPDDDSLSIGDRRTNGSTTSAPKGPVPLRPIGSDGGTAGGKTYEQLALEVKSLGAKLQPAVTEGGQYVIRADVPLDSKNSGQIRRYEGAGPTAAAAMKDLLEQIKSDK